MDFPQYRKLSNNKAFYEILSERWFNEIQVVGQTAFYYEHKADKYPELLRIKEMLEIQLPELMMSSAEEFNSFKISHSL